MAYRQWAVTGGLWVARYTLRQLEIFVDAAGDCNFARAAERLGISQPAVSDHVRALERNLGSDLFVRRRGSTAVLTPAGERLRQDAQAMLEQGERLSGPGAARSVTLRLFAGPHLADGVLRAALPGFHRAHPEISLKIASELGADTALEMLQRKELDLAVFTAPAANLPGEAEVISEAPCCVVASRRLIGDGDLEPAAIGALPFVLPLEGAPGTRWIERALEGLGIVPSNIVARTQYLDVQQRMVEAGAAAALLFRESIERSPLRDDLRRLSPDIPGLQRAMAVRQGDDRPELRAVADFVRAAVREASFGLSSPRAEA
jgi:DNA-binding transcriptional LysR family regulator